DLDGHSAAAVYELLLGRFMKPAAAAGNGRMDRDPFLLDDVGEASLRDRVSVLVVRRSDGCDRVIVRELKQGSVFEEVVPALVVDDTVSGFCDWVLQLLR